MTKCIVKRNDASIDFDNLFNNFFHNIQIPEFGQPKHGSVPRVNIVEKDDAVNLTFELPGMDKGDIKVLVKDKMLTVSGEKKEDSKVENEKYVRSEFSYGSFSRSFNLPDTIDSDSVSADYRNGLLHVVLKKREEAKPKEIEVQVS